MHDWEIITNLSNLVLKIKLQCKLWKNLKKMVNTYWSELNLNLSQLYLSSKDGQVHFELWVKHNSTRLAWWNPRITCLRFVLPGLKLLLCTGDVYIQNIYPLFIHSICSFNWCPSKKKKKENEMAWKNYKIHRWKSL